jgi:toxin FitB
MSPRAKRTTTSALVDSCGWLEYVAGGANAAFFEAALLDTPRLIVPAICLYEVGKRMLITQGESAAREVLAMMQQGRVVQLDSENMADAIIWQTAHSLGATLYTQDAGLQAMPGVSFQLKSKNE